MMISYYNLYIGKGNVMIYDRIGLVYLISWETTLKAKFLATAWKSWCWEELLLFLCLIILSYDHIMFVPTANSELLESYGPELLA